MDSSTLTRPEHPALRAAGSSYYSAFNTAKQLYAEQYGDSIVSNTYLKIALAASIVTILVVTVALCRLNAQTAARLANVKPLVYRVEKLGRVDVLRIDEALYRPGEPEIKYFLSEFCRRHYGRNRLTIAQDFETSTLFLDDELRARVTAAWAEKQTIQNYLANERSSIDIDVVGVAIEDLRTPPYRAQVDYREVYYNDDHTEKTRVSYIAHFTFRFRDAVPSELLRANPIGLAIADFREDAAFK